MLGVLATVVASAGCAQRDPSPVTQSPPKGAATDAATDGTAPPSSGVQDAGALSVKDGIKDAGYDGPYLAALFMQTPIMSDMEWPLPEGSTKRDPAREGVKRIGYMRRGAKAPVVAEAHKKPNCQDGWYELVAGGFVCGKYASLDMNHPRVKLAPHLPTTDGPLPYQYGYNLTHGAPLYRTIPSREERQQYEPWLSAKAKKRSLEEGNPYDVVDAGDVRGPAAATSLDPLGAGLEASDAGTPWYLREHDGGKPQITLDELRGEGPIVRRMVRGFYLALDKEMRFDNGSRWWKNTEGFVVPYDRVFVNDKITQFHGVWLTGASPGPALQAPPPPQPPSGDAGAPRLEDGGYAEPAVKLPTKLPIGFTLWRARKYTPSKDGTKMTPSGETLPRFTAIGLTGKTMRSGGFAFHESDEGWWMRESEGRVTKPGPVPKELKPGEKWIDVSLETQTLVAFEGDKPVFATLISSGKKDRQNKEKNFETKPGSFRIREKHIAATMDGDVASDGPYSIEDVPWIMYFNGSIALHGAFWHTNFGNTRSHGCINLAPFDARAMFYWTEPQNPEGWHGVWSSGEKPGTLVVVRAAPEH